MFMLNEPSLSPPKESAPHCNTNSTNGPVGESQDRLVETRLQVCDEITIPVFQCLLSRFPIEKVRTVYAHDHADSGGGPGRRSRKCQSSNCARVRGRRRQHSVTQRDIQ